MTEDFVRSVLREHTEAERPRGIDPWPVIRDKVLSDSTVLKGYVASDSPRVPLPQAAETAQDAMLRPVPRFVFSAAMLMVLLLALAGVLLTFLLVDSKGDPSVLSSKEAFLPPGKVRHMVYTGTYTYTAADGTQSLPPDQQHHEEFWLVAGESHPLMRSKVTVPITAETWLVEDAFYEYEPERSNEVYKRPYDEKYLAAVVPDPEIITKTLEQPNARLLGDEMLDGRRVAVITISYPPPVSPGEGQKANSTSTVTYWIDRQTFQVVRFVGENTRVGSPQGTDFRDRTVNRIAVNELMDRSELPADFFEFKVPPGTTLVEDEPPIPTSTPLSTMPTP